MIFALAVVTIILTLLAILCGLNGCSEADIANSNISKQSGYFECERRVTVYNARTDMVIMYIEGYIDVSNNSYSELVVTAKVGEGRYKKNYVYLNDYTLYVVEDIDGTTNTVLPRITLSFKTDGTAGSEKLQWNINRLPVITDTRLMCRIWSPVTQVDNLPKLCLCANVMGALRPTKKYINSLKSKVELLKSKGIGAEIDLPVFFDDKFEEAVFNTVPNINADLSVDEVAGSIDELKDMLIGDTKKKAADAEQELKRAKSANNKMKEGIISGAVNQLKEPGIWLKLTLYSPSIAFGALAVLLGILNVVSGKWGAGIAAAASAVLSIAGLILPKRLTKYMSETVYPKIKKRYIMKIKKSLRENELQYEEEIVERAIGESEWIKKVKKAYGIKESASENAPY